MIPIHHANGMFAESIQRKSTWMAHNLVKYIYIHTHTHGRGGQKTPLAWRNKNAWREAKDKKSRYLKNLSQRLCNWIHEIPENPNSPGFWWTCAKSWDISAFAYEFMLTSSKLYLIRKTIQKMGSATIGSQYIFWITLSFLGIFVRYKKRPSATAAQPVQQVHPACRKLPLFTIEITWRQARRRSSYGSTQMCHMQLCSPSNHN